VLSLFEYFQRRTYEAIIAGIQQALAALDGEPQHSNQPDEQLQLRYPKRAEGGSQLWTPPAGETEPLPPPRKRPGPAPRNRRSKS
jgi:hypothetical protein